MSDYSRIIIFLISLSLVILILFFTSKRKLSIKYSILWIISSSVILIFTTWIKLADQITGFLGVGHSPSFYFFLAIIFLLVIVIYFSVELSRITIQIKDLIQEISLLKKTNEKIDEKYSND